MQIKVFRRPIKEVQQLEAEINEWLRANSSLVTIQRESHVYHNPGTGEDAVVVMLWHSRRNEV